MPIVGNGQLHKNAMNQRGEIWHMTPDLCQPLALGNLFVMCLCVRIFLYSITQKHNNMTDSIICVSYTKIADMHQLMEKICLTEEFIFPDDRIGFP